MNLFSILSRKTVGISDWYSHTDFKLTRFGKENLPLIREMKS